MYQNNIAFAKQLDQEDALKKFRQQFHIPLHNNKEVIYFTGNSLGLQPKTTASYIQEELNDWAKHGVEGHFQAKKPWFSYHELLSEKAAKVVGALPSEVVLMNQLSINIHLMMVSFYRPTAQRYKILCEAKAFPSDQYVLETQVKFHGYNPETSIVEVSPREGEHCIRTEDIIAAIEKNKNELALVMIGGVNYYSGQVFDMKTITEAGHKAGAYVGFDLAHAAGNIKLDLHNWNVDFAAWCSYKYLNSGPGSVSGIFVHQQHAHNDFPRFAGWWGHEKETRFLMQKGFKPMDGAEGWQLSNAPIFSMAAHLAALDIVDEAGMDALVAKSKKLSDYLEFVIDEIGEPLEIITPRNKSERGCQISIIAHGKGKELFNKLTENGIIADWREPNVIRMAPVPLYNTFEDIFRFGEILKNAL